MQIALVDEIIEKAISLTPADRRKVVRALQEAERATEMNGGEETGVHPNTIWIKKHHAEYAGKHVALKDGNLIAFGDTIKEANTKAREKGVKNTMLAYLPGDDEELWGGW